jgi:hypothetical protein
LVDDEFVPFVELFVGVGVGVAVVFVEGVGVV